MNDFFKQIGDSFVAVGAAIALAVFGAFTAMPKILNTIKSDKIDGNVLDRIKRHEERMNEMDKTIHMQQIKLTRLQVLVIRLEGLIAHAGVHIHDELRSEIAALVRDETEGE